MFCTDMRPCIPSWDARSGCKRLWGGVTPAPYFMRELYLVASGPSTTDLTKYLSSQMVMAINHAIFHVDSQLAHWQDGIFDQRLHDYTGMAIIPSNTELPRCRHLVYHEGSVPKRNSGVTGLYLACRMGFDPIYLIGYDYYGQGFNEQQTNSRLIYESGFHDLGIIHKTYDTSIYNLSAQSRCDVFPKITIGDALGGYHLRKSKGETMSNRAPHRRWYFFGTPDDYTTVQIEAGEVIPKGAATKPWLLKIDKAEPKPKVATKKKSPGKKKSS